ncbi:MAG: bifunctional 2-C-methyl-D-erythritol 4-phosphate cytidylyltransferase/2-C-methyl-D-erythritol 2,4-cyclodiphosphate synthase, partial [Alphaproteobacteria bacterium]|nr:bifunctional 2-C-methyl-D-erythritol 4-phosphate cytidylyltransferase/2-C-methyl-D-erythritol 2,4-cyclodiphosphate synthase [Alphaproteobacteria bacterium]
AGRGTRFGGPEPKQYLPFGDTNVLAAAAMALRPFMPVACVIHPDDRARYSSATAGLDLLAPVPGGPDRQSSVRNGLEALAGDPPELVLVHDAARPDLPAAVVRRILEALETHDGAAPGLPVADTLKRVEDRRSVATVSRDGLWRIQTPQGFRFSALLEAHRQAAPGAFSDDTALAEAAGLSIAVVQGDARLEKITGPDDAARLSGPDIRTGHGFDVHRLVPGAGVTLCGVRIPHGMALSGHSDADVGMHALTDAILGALAEGDIGRHFPPGDPEWRGAASEIFLARAREMASARGGRILHCDVTLICEAPRIGPHRDAMRAELARILAIPVDRVSVKATTSERLGFTGRGEGIAAQATATLALP